MYDEGNGQEGMSVCDIIIIIKLETESLLWIMFL